MTLKQSRSEVLLFGTASARRAMGRPIDPSW